MFSLNFMFFCSLIEELCTKEENDKTGCNFNFRHECMLLNNNGIIKKKLSSSHAYIFTGIHQKFEDVIMYYFLKKFGKIWVCFYGRNITL